MQRRRNTPPAYRKHKASGQAVVNLSGKIVYLGRIEAVNRKRASDDQLRAGPILPLVDQAVSGFADGTWHIKVYDNYESDIRAFQEKYPVLGNYSVEKMLLPPWEKPTPAEMK